MACETTDSAGVKLPLDSKSTLASLHPTVWFLGYGLGSASGLSLAFALMAIWNGDVPWVAIPALLIMVLHASIIILFWKYRYVVRSRTAIRVSLIASSVLTVSLAVIVSSAGMKTQPLYGLAFMQLLMAFCHPIFYNISKAEAGQQSNAMRRR